VSPWAPKHPCAQPGCAEVLPRGVSRCQLHRRQAWTHERPSSAERGYGAAWRALRAQVLAEEPHCRLCAAEGHLEAARTVDHIVPRAQGGTDDRENLRPLCDRHHRQKSGREGRASR
jgi:5-methylcytosine-specific restriction protein A